MTRWVARGLALPLVLGLQVADGPAWADDAPSLEAALSRHDCAAALPIIKDALAADGTNEAALWGRAFCQADAGAFDQAVETAEVLIKVAPRSRGATKAREWLPQWRLGEVLVRARAAAGGGDPQAAVAILQEAIRHGRSCPSLLGELAVLQTAVASLSVAAQTARRALAARCAKDEPSGNLRAAQHLILAQAALASKQLAAARAAARRAIALADNDSKVAELAHEVLIDVNDEQAGPAVAPEPIYMGYGPSAPTTPPAPTQEQSRPTAPKACGYTVSKQLPKAVIFRCSSGDTASANLESNGKWYLPGLAPGPGHDSLDSAGRSACHCW